ncbi:putative 4-hydroxy-4-methyl-2-oxoglutarate aldolase [Vibrio ostreicida]|uniref:4-hydroxy-4-methyl-2-oxoglutarate aldolase n=1 Tax=Vibrio ostreicida TaxID=526588 RepID=A0ABT8BX13_9VIBR|nr:putative 4-hydroxy-4-methyl-2-oxoglutarate aldolase [Vibrio ostreicida]MDN3610934.1 putative 4-hydroxy-4-methyl-2-oxoglutarate aldolase [Vibrio ostreicida]NPD10514.1 putative 4-hydroxy-4-methyl-2-oxoglutarate aldolase [Vibrio ostreicida]
MKDITPDICDRHEDKVRLLNLPLHTFGHKSAFWGEIVTVRCFHDNSKIKEALSQNGKGKVLIVDGNGSCQKALLGDQLALLAINNHWEGIIIYGAIRDAAAMAEMEIGIKALGTSPFKTEKRGAGEINVTLTVQNQMIQPSDYVYADWNGVLTSADILDWN